MARDDAMLEFTLPGDDIQDVVPGTGGTAVLEPRPGAVLEPRTTVLEPGPGVVLEPPAGWPEPGPMAAAEPVPVAAAGAGHDGAELVPMIVLPGRDANLLERLVVCIRHWAAQAAANQRKHRKLLHWLWWSDPESMGKHFAYVKSRAWVPGHKHTAEGEKRQQPDAFTKFIEWEGVIFGYTIGFVLTLIGNILSGMGQRQSHFWLVVGAVAAAFILWELKHVLPQ